MTFMFVLLQVVVSFFCFVALVCVFDDKQGIKARVFYLVVFLILLALVIGSVYLRLTWRF